MNSDVTCQVDADTVVYADSSLLSRALKEVFKNAMEYRMGTRKPIIRTEMKDEYLSILVENEGKLPDPLPQFFEPWARGDSSRTQGGSGLGLSIVYQIMELHRGKVSIWEENGKVYVEMLFPFLDYVSVV